MKDQIVRYTIIIAGSIAGLAATGCAGSLAEGAACGARTQYCIAECDKVFEIQQNSWDYAACTDRCREQEPERCKPGR